MHCSVQSTTHDHCMDGDIKSMSLYKMTNKPFPITYVRFAVIEFSGGALLDTEQNLLIPYQYIIQHYLMWAFRLVMFQIALRQMMWVV